MAPIQLVLRLPMPQKSIDRIRNLNFVSLGDRLAWESTPANLRFAPFQSISGGQAA